MGDVLIDVVIRHGGRMDFNGSEPRYVGGEESVVGYHTDYLSYRTLNAVAKEDLGYTIVHRMWWLPPKKTMASGLRELFGDNDILYGLMIDVKKVEDGQVVMFFEAEREVSGGWDNEDGNLGDDEGYNSDDDDGADMSVRPPILVLSDDSGESDHGDDPQGKKRRIRTVYYSSGGEEVQQCSSSMFSLAGNWVILPTYPNSLLNVAYQIRWGGHFVAKELLVEDGGSVQRCMWLEVYGSWNSRKESFILKCLGENHTCPRASENKQASAKWIAKTYIEKFRITPKWDISDMKRELELTYGIRINDNKCYRSRNEARILLEDTLEEEHKKLRPYVAALQNDDPEGKFVLEVDVRAEDKVTFKRMYVGFSSLFKGFLAGCRPMIGFNACFLKGELPGMLLSAVGKDGDNGMFPLAWAAYDDFVRQEPKRFCRAFRSTAAKSDSVESNVCESFNNAITKYRDLRIIKLLEGIRTYIMVRMVDQHKAFAAMRDVICPSILEQIEWTKIQARTCIIEPSLDDVLQCTDHGRGFIVDLRRHICTCGYWQLSGVLCVHGVAAIAYMRYDVTGYVEKCYSVQLAKKAYVKGVPPLPGREDWVDVEGLPVLPPPHKVMPGRPKKNRRKEPGEVSTRPSLTGVGTMMRKTRAVMHCSRCGQTDHNVRGCKMTDEEVAAIPPPPPPRPVGRPRRAPIEEQQQREGNDQPTRRRKIRCKHCKHFGHNIRGCPVRRGVQPGSIGRNTPRLVVEREIRQAMRGVGVHISPDTENQYFATGAGVRLEEVDMNPDIINQSQQPGTQPPNTQPRST
ncbi:hypothetical protein LINPERHAP2_LOCUS33998 [Linum perenne]